MKDDAKRQLERILGAYDERLVEADRLDAASRAAKAAFPERFARLRIETILPVLRELADVLNRSGHEATTYEQEESSSTSGGITSAAVSLRVIPKPFAQRPPETKRSFVDITLAANRRDRKIVVSSTNTIINSGGSVGKRGEYEIEMLTADIVVNHVLETLEEAFAADGSLLRASTV
jgi:hypothetical protein